MNQPKKTTYKYCIVPKCKNTTSTTPNKVFFVVPRGTDVRKKWCKIMKRKDMISPSTCLYCCEDHFNVEEDTSNYMEYKIMNLLENRQAVVLRLKKGTIPHKFQCQEDAKQSPRIRKGSSKRKHKEMIEDALCVPPAKKTVKVKDSKLQSPRKRKGSSKKKNKEMIEEDLYVPLAKQIVSAVQVKDSKLQSPRKRKGSSKKKNKEMIEEDLYLPLAKQIVSAVQVKDSKLQSPRKRKGASKRKHEGMIEDALYWPPAKQFVSAVQEVCSSSETLDASLQDEDEVGQACEVCLLNINNEDEFQFVCLQCADVFLCKACFEDGQHAHHYMLRIPKDKPPDEVSRVVSRLRTELMTENNSQEQAVPQVKQEVDDMSEQEQAVPEQEHDISEQQQTVSEDKEHYLEPSPHQEDEVQVKIERDPEPDPLTVYRDTTFEITIKEELVEDEIDRRRVEPCVEQVVGRTHTTTATHSHTKRAPSGDSEAGPSKVARSTGTGPHYTSTGGRHHTTDTREKPSSNVQVMYNVLKRENNWLSKT